MYLSSVEAAEWNLFRCAAASSVDVEKALRLWRGRSFLLIFNTLFYLLSYGIVLCGSGVSGA
jgi:hypothetical protein